MQSGQTCLHFITGRRRHHDGNDDDLEEIAWTLLPALLAADVCTKHCLHSSKNSSPAAENIVRLRLL
jgi:hypothetical protein